jgi:hypothetical protein
VVVDAQLFVELVVAVAVSPFFVVALAVQPVDALLFAVEVALVVECFLYYVLLFAILEFDRHVLFVEELHCHFYFVNLCFALG